MLVPGREVCATRGSYGSFTSVLSFGSRNGLMNKQRMLLSRLSVGLLASLMKLQVCFGRVPRRGSAQDCWTAPSAKTELVLSCFGVRRTEGHPPTKPKLPSRCVRLVPRATSKHSLHSPWHGVWFFSLLVLFIFSGGMSVLLPYQEL